MLLIYGHTTKSFKKATDLEILVIIRLIIHLVLGLCGFELCDSLIMREFRVVKLILGICGPGTS